MRAHPADLQHVCTCNRAQMAERIPLGTELVTGVKPQAARLRKAPSEIFRDTQERRQVTDCLRGLDRRGLSASEITVMIHLGVGLCVLRVPDMSARRTQARSSSTDEPPGT